MKNVNKKIKFFLSSESTEDGDRKKERKKSKEEMRKTHKINMENGKRDETAKSTFHSFVKILIV